MSLKGGGSDGERCCGAGRVWENGGKGLVRVWVSGGKGHGRVVARVGGGGGKSDINRSSLCMR